MQQIRLDRSIKLSNLFCINQTKPFILISSAFFWLNNSAETLPSHWKKTFILIHLRFFGIYLQEQASLSWDTNFPCVLLRLSEEQSSSVFIWRHEKKNVWKETVSSAKMAPRSWPCCIRPILSLAWSIPKDMPRRQGCGSASSRNYRDWWMGKVSLNPKEV